MSLYDYKVSQEIATHDYPFYALVMALIRDADTPNTLKLKLAWPEAYAEMKERYNAPGGLLPGELPRD